MVLACNIPTNINFKVKEDKILVFKLVQDTPLLWALGYVYQLNLSHRSKKVIFKEVTKLSYLKVKYIDMNYLLHSYHEKLEHSHTHNAYIYIIS